MELGLIEFGPIGLVLDMFVVIVAQACLARRVGVACVPAAAGDEVLQCIERGLDLEALRSGI